MKTYTAKAGSSLFVYVYKRFRNPDARAIFTNKNNQVTIIEDAARFYDASVDFRIGQELLTDANLPATVQLQISQNGGGFQTIETIAIAAPAPASGTLPERLEEDELDARFVNEEDYAPARMDDQVILEALNQKGSSYLHRYSGAGVFDYQDSTEVILNLSALSGIPAAPTLQVSGNKLFTTGTSTSPVMFTPLSRNIVWGEKFHISTFIDWTTTVGSSATFFGLAFGDRTLTTTDLTDTLSAGFTATGIARLTQGTAVGSSGSGNSDQTISPSAGRYNLVFDSDGEQISISLRHRDDTTKIVGLWTIKWSIIPNNKVIGRILHYLVDSRGLTGHSIGPAIANIGSVQPHRTKVVAAHTLENTAARDFKRISNSGPQTDEWRIALPKNYDPRKPAPLVLFFHPAGSSVKTADRPWVHTSERGVTNALLDAGYIVATSQDGFVLGNANTDRYANDVSLAEMAALDKWVRKNFSVSQTCLFGVSMGMLTATNLLARRTVPNITAGYFIDGGTNISSIFASSDPQFDVYKEPLRVAYGIAQDNSDALTKLAGRDSNVRPWYDFRGIPVRCISGSGDTTAPPATHTAFLAKLAPYVPEASQNILTGAHTAANHYVPSDVVDFFNRHVS